MYKFARWFTAAIILSAGAFSFAELPPTVTLPNTTTTRPKLEEQEKLINAVKGSFVSVEYTLQYDKGEAPHGTSFTDRCPFCGDFHSDALDDLIREERPLQKTGLMIDKNTILTSDVQINPRFIKSITVRACVDSEAGNTGVTATIASYAKSQNAVILHIDGEVAGVTPAAFDGSKAGPYSLVLASKENGMWTYGLHPMGGDLMVSATKKVVPVPAGLAVDSSGTPVGVSTGSPLPPDDSWKGSPTQWPAISSQDMSAAMSALQASTDKSIVRVTLNFRSPKNLDQQALYRNTDDTASAAEQQVLGLILDDKQILILADLKPKVTARLQRIKVFTDPPIEATFKASLTDYGAFVADLKKPAEGSLKFSTQSLQDLTYQSLPSADILLQGDKRVAYFQPLRFSGLVIGWRKNLYPDLASMDRPTFLFDSDGALLALPMQRRQKASVEERYENNSTVITPVAQLAAVLSDLSKGSDPSNVPLAEADENRIAWLGFELQAMNKELARANGVSDQTNDGETGALVTYVYPDSPAAKAGVEAGWVLLRVDAADQPKPIDVKIENDPFADRPFPWDRLGEAPESIFDRIPTPWPKVENALVRNITDLGFGKTFTAEFFHDGKVEKKDFTIVQGPSYYQNAPKYKLDVLGLTVKDMTYEVRRYMQKKPDEPGVIISKIEMGSKASAAGLKPYEVITHVNDKPVLSVKDFETAVTGQTELRLSVKRMTRGRIVKVDITPAASQPAGDATN